MHLADFNRASDDDARSVLRPCVDIERWIDGVLARRPYASRDALASAAEAVATPFSADEVAQALSHHPRIGERASGQSAEAELSRGEQATLSVDDDVQRQLEDGNREYEERFGRVFLIRAAGRSSEEILEQLQQRLSNDEVTESVVVAEQLRQIAVLRLKGAIDA